MIVVDTDVLIAHLRGHSPAREWLRQARRERGRLATSVVSTAEVVGGMRSTERREVAALLASLRPLPVTNAIAYRAGELRRQYRRSHHSIGLVDHLVASTVELHGAELATLNVRHFPMFQGLRPPFPV